MAQIARAPRGRTIPVSLVILAAVIALPVSPAFAQDEAAGTLQHELRRMITNARDQVFPALVHIKVTTVNYFGGVEQKGGASGSGTIISDEGHVLTNFHVVDSGCKFICTMADKQEIPAELIGEDPLTDLAILKLDLSAMDDPDAPLHVASFGDSDAVEIGDTVMAMGSPWALSRSVTQGIVSNTERILTGSGGQMYIGMNRTGLFNIWIQHDAAINPGNSGGPLVNLDGRIIGVNTRGGGNMGFAIPSGLARSVAERLIEHGEVPRSWYGWSIKSIKKSGYEKGVLVDSVIDDGPVQAAGIQAGDVVIAVNGKPVTAQFPEQVPPLMKDMADLPIGGEVAIDYLREGEPGTAVVITDKLLSDKGDESAFRAWGFSAMQITEKMARDYQLDRTDGVLVTSVRGGSPAQTAEPPISGRDVIVRVDDTPVPDLATFVETYNEIMEADDIPEYLLIEFDRRGRNQLTLIKPVPDDEKNPPREVAKAWIGVAVQPVVKRLARHIGGDGARGFRITRIYPHTLAVESELQVGDIISSLNGEDVQPRGIQDSGLFHREVRRLRIDDTAALGVFRDGVAMELAVQLERTRIGPSEARREKNTDFDLTVRQVTFFDRDGFRWDEDVKGAIIAEVEPAGWAGQAGLRPYDLIQRIDHDEVRGLKSFRKAMKKVAEKRPERVVFVVLRGRRSHFQFAEPEWAPAPVDTDSKDTQDDDVQDQQP